MLLIFGEEMAVCVFMVCWVWELFVLHESCRLPGALPCMSFCALAVTAHYSVGRGVGAISLDPLQASPQFPEPPSSC